MKIDMYKVIDNVMVFLLVFFILMAILAYPIAHWPHFEKAVYEKQEPLTWESMEQIQQSNVEKYGEKWRTNFTGYPTEGMRTVLISDEQFQYEESNVDDVSSMFEQWSNALKSFDENAPDEIYCLEVDVEDLEPTGLYKRVYEFKLVATGGSGVGVRRSASTGTKSAEQYTASYIKTVLNRSKAIYAQYYALTLEDGNTILVLLNDTVLKIPKKGKIELPLAEKSWLSFDGMEKIRDEFLQKYNLNYSKSWNETHVLDAATDWMFLNEDIEKAHEDRAMLWLILFCVGIGGTFLTFFISVILIKKVK